ncbi:MAG: PEP/pyruvate-binding domain-containing protein [Desulfohalobiaceae bacterium]
MTWTVALNDVREDQGPRVGGKAVALARLYRAGVSVPPGLCITTQAYHHFLDATGLRDRILMELSRKAFERMRWEEMWDAALRIRNMFLTAPMPRDLEEELGSALDRAFPVQQTVVRSSAPGEDSAQASFAGLHESWINVVGRADLLAAIRKVWSSLFSDAALLYQNELDLDATSSGMAVLVQELVSGLSSGVVFTKSPEDESAMVVEAVHGLNEGLVDGAVEPDRWILNRETKEVLSSFAPNREGLVLPAENGTVRQALAGNRHKSPPLDSGQLNEVVKAAGLVERIFGPPQDVEWTIHDQKLYILQSRPITTIHERDGDDGKGWYLSLRRSLNNLISLRERIEREILPEMNEQAEILGQQDLALLSHRELAKEIQRRHEVHKHWIGVYWEECIPFAHGARLFGQVYNDAVKPSDPFEFIQLLGSDSMLSLERNSGIQALAERARDNPALMEALEKGDPSEEDRVFGQLLEDFLDRYGELFCNQASCTRGRSDVLALVAKLALHPSLGRQSARDSAAGLEANFFEAMGPHRRAEAEEILDLARASYRLRDDDNIYLGRIEAEILKAAEEGMRRLGRDEIRCDIVEPLTVAAALQDPEARIQCREEVVRSQSSGEPATRPRQLPGQPAGPGVVQGRARVVSSVDDLRSLEPEEILVCDAVDPKMTAIVVLASGIVERRGGMLIHGAIIAREYGLPCVTGVHEALEAIRTGDVITVDGYMGTVTLGREEQSPRPEDAGSFS